MKKLIAFVFALIIVSISYSQTKTIRVCVVENKTLKEVQADYNTTTGDTTLTVSGKKISFGSVYPGFGNEYAAGATWYINNEKISGKGKNYVKYGLPRVLGVSEVMRITEYKGVGVYAESGSSGVPEIIYIPVRSGCEFQPYQVEVVRNKN